MRSISRFVIVPMMVVVMIGVPGRAAAVEQTGGFSGFNGVSLYLHVYYNQQTVGGNTYYQIYSSTYRFWRSSTSRQVKYAFYLGESGRDESGQNANKNLSTVRGLNPCWGPCGDSTSTLWSRTQTNNVSWPYVTVNTDLDWIGQNLPVRVYLSGTHVGDKCANNMVDGTNLVCVFNF